MKKHTVSLCFLAVALFVSIAPATLITINSASPSDNAASMNRWLVGTGIGRVEHLVNFENFATGTHLEGKTSLLPGLVITVSKHSAQVRAGSRYYFGRGHCGPKPSRRALALTESQILTLDFSSSPIDYISFFSINAATLTGNAYLTDGRMVAFNDPDGGGALGNTASFFGIYLNSLPNIAKITLQCSPLDHVWNYGRRPWGIDEIRYGVAPEPLTVILFGFGGLMLRGRYSI
ncbi:MAG: hypothetical protein A2Y07_07135 [Planctomycetes bacterium GWF2_50_10]|nr:MAG: hypothetical protein A2Y07_07135 [Planctomycetes bacterium GWF2_50_10]